MPQFDDKGLFAGLSKDDKAAAVLECLSVDRETTLQELMSATGLTGAQVHAGIRHLREAKPNCVVTYRRGVASAYKIAEDAPEVRDYAVRRMRHWRSEVDVMRKEMDTAKNLLPGGEAAKVGLATEILQSLLKILEYSDVDRRENDKRERDIARREAKLKSRPPRKQKVPALAAVETLPISVP
jgi:hypothetical protein